MGSNEGNNRVVFRSGGERATITGPTSTEVNVIGVLSLGYCQAVLERTKPSSEKTTSFERHCLSAGESADTVHYAFGTV